MKHKAFMITNSGEFFIKKISTPIQKPDELLIAPVFVGLCGTDLQIARRQRNDSAVILGHEGIGRIISVGSKVEQFKVGQNVVFNPVNPLNQNEILGHSYQGLFQERYLVSAHAIDRGLIIPVPDSISMDIATMAEPLGTVIYGHELINTYTRPKNIIIIGLGPIGLLHALFARLNGCINVFAISTSIERLNWAVKQGILRKNEAYTNPKALRKKLFNLANTSTVDAIFLCTTKPTAKEALKISLEYIRDEGCIDMVGGFSDGDEILELPGQDLNLIRRSNICGKPVAGNFFIEELTCGKKVVLTGHRGTSKKHIFKAIDLLIKNPSFFSKIISHKLHFSDLPKLFTLLVKENEKVIFKKEYIKAIIRIQN